VAVTADADVASGDEAYTCTIGNLHRWWSGSEDLGIQVLACGARREANTLMYGDLYNGELAPQFP